jgi:hypothetical protein
MNLYDNDIANQVANKARDESIRVQIATIVQKGRKMIEHHNEIGSDFMVDCLVDCDIKEINFTKSLNYAIECLGIWKEDSTEIVFLQEALANLQLALVAHEKEEMSNGVHPVGQT